MFDIPASSASAAADDRAHPTERIGAGRYAPSPTGDLHLGNLRTALLAWLFARSTSRRFLLRIEDLDSGRVRPGIAEQQLSDLTALGITFDGEPVVQSRRLAAYEEALRSLADRDVRVLLQPAGDRPGRIRTTRGRAALSRDLPKSDRGRSQESAADAAAGAPAASRRSVADHPRRIAWGDHGRGR